LKPSKTELSPFDESWRDFFVVLYEMKKIYASIVFLSILSCKEQSKFSDIQETYKKFYDTEIKNGDTTIYSNKKYPRIEAEFFSGSDKYWTQHILRTKINDSVYGNYFYFKNEKLERFTFYCGDSILASYEIDFRFPQNPEIKFGNPFVDESDYGQDSLISWVCDFGYDSTELFRFIKSSNLKTKPDISEIRNIPFVKGYVLEKNFKDSLILVCYRNGDAYTFHQ